MPVKPPCMLAKPSSKILRSCAVALMATELMVSVVLPPCSVKVAVFSISTGHSGLRKWRVSPPFGIGEGHHEDDTLGLDDLAIDEAAPHLLAVRRAQAVVEHAAGPEIERAGDPNEALRPPPMFQALELAMRLPDEIARRIEHAGDDEGA